MSYRKRRGSDTWHMCSSCSNWPSSGYDSSSSRPSSGELCNECLAKQRSGTCA